ncbi:MAG: alpha-amylase [Treponema sp.]|nr:alpha-amylase [Treponema sp.]
MKEDKLNLVLGSHAHVPSGAGENEYRYVYENKMRPFVSNLSRYSKINAVLHYSGVLLYWVERNHPEFFMLIEDMIARKQVEILSGGFYEPMLPLLPPQDRIGQIELLTTYLRKHFGKRPQGCWIPVMAWEQHLVSALSASDMNYTFLSEDQFINSGMKGDALYYPCYTEDQGKLITVFPVSTVGAELSEKSFSEVFAGFKKQIGEEGGFFYDRIITIFPDKASGASEESQDSAWNRFFEELTLSENFIETTLPSKILKSHKPHKRCAFLNSTNLNDGFLPRNFMIEHGESGGIYSKMIFTNVLISQLKGDKSRKLNAREELWKAQDSSLFTPGGFHRHELRKAAYSSLLRAERLSREKGKFTSSLIQYDFDFDGVEEYLFQDTRINCYIRLKGAGIFELDYLPKDWNYLDCGCAGNVRRAAFSDAILPPETKAQDIAKGFPKGSRLCFNEQFEAVSQDRKGKSCFKLPALEKNTAFANIEIEKCYSLKRDILTVNYTLKNQGKKHEIFCFVPEIVFSFAGEGEEFARFFTSESGGKDTHVSGTMNAAESIKILDVKNEVQILLCSLKAFSGCLGLAYQTTPAQTGGLYQANRILPLFSVSLESGQTWINEFSLKFSH